MSDALFSWLMGFFAVIAWFWSVYLSFAGNNQEGQIYFAMSLGSWALARTFRPVPPGKGLSS